MYFAILSNSFDVRPRVEMDPKAWQDRASAVEFLQERGRDRDVVIGLRPDEESEHLTTLQRHTVALATQPAA
jgi:hypothetical protein